MCSKIQFVLNCISMYELIKSFNRECSYLFCNWNTWTHLQLILFLSRWLRTFLTGLALRRKTKQIQGSSSLLNFRQSSQYAKDSRYNKISKETYTTITVYHQWTLEIYFIEMLEKKNVGSSKIRLFDCLRIRLKLFKLTCKCITRSCLSTLTKR